jgi:hypothetical protein
LENQVFLLGQFSYKPQQTKGKPQAIQDVAALARNRITQRVQTMRQAQSEARVANII